MRRIFRLSGITMFFLLTLFILSYAADETLTITTYYPTPQGSYNNLDVAGDLTVGGTVGIGTTNPNAKLTVEGGAISHDNANNLYGTQNATHINLGVSSTTGTSGSDQSYCTIGGGYSNYATASYSTIAGGYSNNATDFSSTVGGGYFNNAAGNYSTIGGGYFSNATGNYSTIGGGYFNNAAGLSSTIGGGYNNNGTGNYSTIAGGRNNNAAGINSTIGGGAGNNAAGPYSTVGGGYSNNATGPYSTVGGGYDNEAAGINSTIAGGRNNNAAGINSTIGGGAGNNAANFWSTVGGGTNNNALSVGSTIAGGRNNNATGTSSTVGGGIRNNATGSYSTVAGGFENNASGSYSTVGGGHTNKATGPYSAVPGGTDNTASGAWTTLAGGFNNKALANYAYISGGANNTVTAPFGWAGGENSNVNSEHSFVWSDGKHYASKAENSFSIHARAGIFHGGGIYGDVAEFMDVLKQDRVEESEIVSLINTDLLGKSKKSYDDNLVGVITSRRTCTLHLGDTEDDLRKEGLLKKGVSRLPVSLVGRSFVKVCAESGAIKLGDAVTSSSIPGVGMKAAKSGKVVGYAMENTEFKDTKEVKEILVFVNLGYYLSPQDMEKLRKE